MTISGRTTWRSSAINADGAITYTPGVPDVRERVPEAESQLVSSLLDDGQHAPALDLDVPARIEPSSTPGHSHLFIDVAMPWAKYEQLLRVLADVGILESGYVVASIEREQTMLRQPWCRKPDAARELQESPA